jgi:hypothetical protein
MTGFTFISGKVVLLLSPSYLKALSEELESYRLPLGEEAARSLPIPEKGVSLIVSARDRNLGERRGRLCFYDKARLHPDGSIGSQDLSRIVSQHAQDTDVWMMILLENVASDSQEWRCVVHRIPDPRALLEIVPEDRRLVFQQELDRNQDAVVLIDSDGTVESIVAHCSREEPELFSLPARVFLSSPSAVGLLLRRVYELPPEDATHFVHVATTIAHHLRSFLEDERVQEIIRIGKATSNQIDAWVEWQNKKVCFLDGGIGEVGVELPLPIMEVVRIGWYVVEPGNEQMEGSGRRERFGQEPFLVSDIVERRDEDLVDRAQLLQASRILLELLRAVELANSQELAVQLVHGPLVTKYNQYDDERPNYVPALKRDFLAEHEIGPEGALASVCPLPPNEPGSEHLWNHFMAVYGAVARRAIECATPIVGVVERSSSLIATRGLLDRLCKIDNGRLVERRVAETIVKTAQRFRIDDTLLFGCLLDEGEYLDPPFPVVVANPVEVRQRWRDVVEKYPQPYVTMLKPVRGQAPFRVETNESGTRSFEGIARLLYRSSTLLPEYGFPVGFSVVDRYARVPQWTTGAARDLFVYRALTQLLRNGKKHQFVEARRMLAGMGRSFFERPT